MSENQDETNENREQEGYGDNPPDTVEAHFKTLVDLFTKLNFREYWAKVKSGLNAPKDSGDYKWAKFQVLRLCERA